MNSKTPKLRPTSLMKKADKAIRSAISKVMADHKRLGLPIYVWQHNKVVRIPARHIPTR